MVKIYCHYDFRVNNTHLCAITVHGLIFPACRRKYKDGAYQSLHFVTDCIIALKQISHIIYSTLAKKNVGLLGCLAMSSISSS